MNSKKNLSKTLLKGILVRISWKYWITFKKERKGYLWDWWLLKEKNFGKQVWTCKEQTGKQIHSEKQKSETGKRT
jgi:hypothetical protein